MKIRLMKIADYQQVLTIWKTVGLQLDEYDDSKEKISQVLLKNPNSCLVAEVNQKIIAAVLGTSDGKRAWIYHLGVHPKFQRQGIGTALINRLTNYFSAKGITKVNLMLLKRKWYLLPFYKKLGFVKTRGMVRLERELSVSRSC